MAWRIEDSVQRGELDNRERGIVRGKFWLHGITDPITVELRGDACPDLAGCLLTFENPSETFPLHMDGFNPLQKGVAGDLTASRKVRVVEVDDEDAPLDLSKPLPEQLANSLYLEWFSESNGRVVIESANYKLTISPPLWKLSPEEEEQRQKAAAAGFQEFMKQFDVALEQSTHQLPQDKEWDEFDYERFMRESDARTDKYMELLEKYGDTPESEEIIAREMGWDRDAEEAEWELESAESSSLSGQADLPGATSEGGDMDDLVPVEPDASTEGVDWIRREDGDICHPLYARAFEGAVGLMNQCEESGLLKREDRDLDMLLGEYQITTAKLAGALNSLAYGRDLQDGPFVVARLKRALNHLHNTQAALEAVASKKLLPQGATDATRTELFSLREEILRLMQEFRGQES